MKYKARYFLILSIILLYYGISGLFTVVHFNGSGLIEVEGTITALHEKAGSRGAAFHPIVAFTDENGNSYTFTSKSGSNSYKRQVGKAVKVVFPPGFPEEARIKGSLFKDISPVVFLLSGTVLFILWYSESQKNKKEKDDQNEE